MDNYLTSAVVWSIVWLIIGILLTLGASLLTARTLFPEFSERCAGSCARPVRHILLGLVAAAVAGGLVALMQRLGQGGQLPTLLIIGTVILMSLAGVSGQVVRMARRSMRSGEDPAGWPAAIRGTAALTLTYLLPVAGWFLVLPLSLLCGLGCTLRNLRTAKAKSQTTPPATVLDPVMPPMTPEMV
ncbi:MAG: hypothetical protein JWM59_1696 [Verrucomicrobiales bacterium]|nr:hypothetical protein [Verrucomicrobiales bacterium]